MYLKALDSLAAFSISSVASSSLPLAISHRGDSETESIQLYRYQSIGQLPFKVKTPTGYLRHSCDFSADPPSSAVCSQGVINLYEDL